MKKYWRLLITLIILIGGYFSVPPYTIQATYYFFKNIDQLNELDKEFSSSKDEKWASQYNLAPINKNKNGARIYYMGTLDRFGNRYDIAYMKGSKPNEFCSCRLRCSKVDVRCAGSLDLSG